MQKNVLVAGADGALGRAAFKHYADLGCHVIGTAFSEGSAAELRSMLTTTGGAGDVSVVDLSSHDGCQAFAEKTLQRHSRIDWLFSAVGGFRYTSTTGCSAADFSFLINANFVSCWHLAKFFAPAMERRKYGRMVFVSAKKTQEPGQANFGIYTATKSALSAMVAGLADEMKESGVTANMIAPTIIDTPANRDAMPGSDYSKWVTTDDLLRTVDFLFSDRASAVNGATITVSGRL
jgi:NAD(P)-dependent dehydrogenase (short-subunit alcohol dehydrogenase family)